jgi:hypothetical protein
MKDNFVQDDQSFDQFDLILHIKIHSQEVEVTFYKIKQYILFEKNLYKYLRD